MFGCVFADVDQATMSKLDEHVSVAAVEKAVSALLSHVEKTRNDQDESELLGAREDFVWLVVATKRMSPEKKLKPYRMCVSCFQSRIL